MVQTQNIKLKELINLLNAQVLTKHFNPDTAIGKGFASDLMSDVLTLQVNNLLLITGLSNIQTIRTAEMADIEVVLIVRNKTVSDDMIALANENNITLLRCEYSLFRATGMLYNVGLSPIY